MQHNSFWRCHGTGANFLIQNMFAVTQKYIDAVYIDKNTKNEVTVSPQVESDVVKNARSILKLSFQHKHLVFGDIQKIYTGLSLELQQQKERENSISDETVTSKNAEEPTSDDETSETTIVDAFENISFNMSKNKAYPQELNITMNSENAPLGDSGYDMEVISAGTETILLHVSLDMEKAEVYQQENNCAFEEQEKDFEIEIQNSDMRTYLISESLFTDDNCSAILEDMQSSLVNKITYQNEMKLDITAEFHSNNPDNQIEVEPDSSTDVTLEGLYITVSEEDVDFMQLLSLDSSSPGIIWLSFNSHVYTPDFSVYGIYKGTDDAYYVASNKPVFVDRKYTEGRSGQLKYEVDILNSKLAFPDKETALQCVQEKIAEQNITVLKEIQIEE